MANRAELLYVETDLPDIHANRLALRTALEGEGVVQRAERCTFAVADLLSRDDIERVAALLQPGEP